MNYRMIGKDLTVSAVGLGCMGMSHAYGAPADKKEMTELLAQAVDMGYTFFDTAEVYGTADNICEVKPAVLQTEVHPYNQEKELKAFLNQSGMVIQAWYPLGHGDAALLEEPVFAKLGEKYHKSPAQIILRWHVLDGNIVIPGSKNPAHIRDNFELFEFNLTGEEMAEIAELNQNKRYYTSTPELLAKYAQMVPPVDEQK